MVGYTRLSDRYGEWALVTGGSSGIGRSLAHQLAAERFNLVLLSNQPQELDNTAADVTRAHGVKALACCVDLADPDFLDRVRQTVGHRRISVLVNNASFGTIGDFLTHSLETYQSLVTVNIGAYVALTHEFLPGMRTAGRGALLFVSSFNALQPVAKSSVYTASKAFEMYFGCALWRELRGSGVDVLVVLPGPTKTAFQKVAGTQVASWAMEPDAVAREAIDALGREMLCIPGRTNRLLAAVSRALPMKRRIAAASRLLEASLINGNLRTLARSARS